MKYEVKLRLDPAKVVDGFGELTKDIQNLFSVKTQKEIAVQFMDTEDFAFKQAGWVNRIRNKEETKDFVLTFKKRFDVQGDNVSLALQAALEQGFEPDGKFEAEVDWGFEHMMLSFSHKKEIPNKSYEQLELPDQEKTRQLLQDKLPKKLVKEMGEDLFSKTRLFGPLIYTQYTGKFKGTKLTLEIWPIKTDFLVEISFKDKKFKDVVHDREALITVLEEKNWLLHEESLKTHAVLEA